MMKHNHVLTLCLSLLFALALLLPDQPALAQSPVVEQVANINPTSNSSPAYLTVFNNKLYFQADGGGGTGAELWVYDGITTTMVANVNPDNYGSSSPSYLTVFNDKLYFQANGGGVTGAELWVYDGITTTMVANINPNNYGNSSPTYLTVFNNKLYFSASDGSTGAELWVYDGSNTPSRVADIYSGAMGSSLAYLTVFNNKLYFSASDGSTGAELWVYDGSNAPSRVADINSAGNSSPSYLTVFNSKLYFSASDGSTGAELWVYDGSNAPSRVADIWSGSIGSIPAYLTVFDNKLYFQANDGSTGKELWVYDGSNAPSRVADINSAGNSSPSYLTVFNNKLYFSVNDGITGAELWVFDGSNAPSQVANINPNNYGSSSPAYLTIFDNKLYFQANDGITGAELWRLGFPPPPYDVAIVKTAAPAAARPGETITYTLAFHNAGGEAATGVIITDSVPLTVTNLSVSSSGAAITPIGSAPNLVWQVADLGPDEGGVITLTGVLSNPLAVGIFTNTVEITATGDSDPANNQSGVALTVQNVAPVAADDETSTTADTAVTVSPLENDSDANGDPLTISALGVPANGTATNSDTAQVVYTPTTSFSGFDSFSYTASDGTLTDTALITVAVNICTPSVTSGNWSGALSHCLAGSKIVIPAGYTITLDQDINLTVDLEVQPGGVLDAVSQRKTVTLTGGAAQTLTGNPLTLYRLTLNKTNAGDTVTISGKLKVTNKLRVTTGKLISASDYEDIEIGPAGTLELTSDITVSGHFTNTTTGAFIHNNHTVTFDGGKAQNLYLESLTQFYNLTVYTDTILIETMPDATGTPEITNQLINYGKIRKSQPVSAADFYYFGLAGTYPSLDFTSYGLEINVTDRTGGDPLTAIQVDRIDKPHPNGVSGAGENIYWTITPTGADFVADVTLPHNGVSTPLACRYSGGVWSCTNDGSDTDYVTYGGATVFSDWAVFSCVPAVTVTDAGDSGAGTLRQAVADVCPGGVVDFDATLNRGTITLTSGEIAIDKALTIDGPGRDNLTVSGNNASRIFNTSDTVTISGLTLRDGYTANSGGAIQTTAPLTLTAVAVISNTAATWGGAIYNNGGSLTLTNADISGNVASSAGGAIYNNGGSLTLTNTGFSGNISSGANGGAIYNDGGTAALTNILFSGNKAASGGAIYNNSSLQLINATFSGNLAPYNPGGAIANAGSGTVQLVNGVVWGNSTSGPPGAQIYNTGSTVTLSYTLIQSGTGSIDILGSVIFGPGVITTDPLFVAPIAATSAPTTTGNYRLQTGSPAIDSGDNSAVAVLTDLDRNVRIQGGAVDMGAYEFNVPDVALSKTVSPTSAKPGYAITYTLTFSNAGGETAIGVVITDSVPVSVTNLSVISGGVAITSTGAAPNFVWQVEDLAPNAGGVITLTGVLSNPLAAGVFANTAEITATGDSNAANNRSSAAISVSDYDARLASLAVSSGALTPAFISTTTSYTAEVTNLTNSVTVTPTVSDANATLSVNGTPLGSGEPFTLTPLVVGPNVISTTVTAEDGVTQQTYVITVTRLGADGDWYVDPVGDNGNSCRAPGVGYACQTIIGAMDKSVSGDRIFIAAATYTESLVVTKSLTFIGVGGPIVSGGGTNRVFSITTGVDVTLDGLAVANGRLSGATPATGAGAGIYNRGALTLTTTVVTNNVASSAFAGTGGGGIYNAAPGVLRLFDSSVISNSGFYGSGLYVAGGAATLDHSTVLTNAVASNDAAGAGLYIDGAGTVVTVTNASRIAGNRVTGTTSASRGGGVFVNAGLLRVSDSTVAHNAAGNSGGGIAVSIGASAELTASTVFSNVAGTSSSHYGGGIFSMGVLTLTNSTVTSNWAGASGGGVYQFGNGLIIAGSVITNNNAKYYGGGVYVQASAAAQATISDSEVAHNNATSDGGGINASANVLLTVVNDSIFGNTSSGSGGGIYVDGKLTVTETDIRNNRANSKGGAIWASGILTLTNVHVISNTAGNNGGGVYGDSQVTITGGELRGNAATPTSNAAGGGLYAAGNVILEGVAVAANSLYSANDNVRGGGVYGNANVIVYDSALQNNQATTNGWAVSATGGGLYANGTLVLSNTQVISNAATGNSCQINNQSAGGGVYAAGSSNTATVTDALFQGNSAGCGSDDRGKGGAIYANSSLTVTATEFVSNTTNNMGGAIFGANAVVLNDTEFLRNTAMGASRTDLGGMEDSGGGAVYAESALTVTGARFSGNYARNDAGAVYALRDATFDRVQWVQNSADRYGGALFLANQSGYTRSMRNVLLVANSAAQGAAIFDDLGALTLQFATIVSPTVGAGPAISITRGAATIVNSIVASYTTGIAASPGATVNSDYNLFFAAPTSIAIGGNSITGVDPRFIDPAAGDYRLATGSPAINAAQDVGVTTDLDGALRPQGGGFDIGSYEVNHTWYVD
jgi:uncharacterized repeat protein (TIGR01451 family)